MATNDSRRAEIRVEKVIAEKASSLSLAYFDLELIPQRLDQCTFLQSLDLSLVKLKSLDFLEYLPNLEYLNLGGNPIVDFSIIKKLKKIKHLVLSTTNLFDISFLESLSGIEFLDLCNNKIGELKYLSELTNLKTLLLSVNKINNLEVIKCLSQIKCLDVSRNSISDISAIKSLTDLQELNIENNLIRDLSPIAELRQNMGSLNKKVFDRNLQVEQNPVSYPPPEIYSRGNESILNFFNEVEVQGLAQLFEAKLLILGEGGVGKTTLANRLVMNDKASIPKEEDTTRGIDILEYFFYIKKRLPFKVHIWDFGGQEIYHSTHQFFLTKRSLYLLVDDTRKSEKSINDISFHYWLQIVELLGEGSPVLIIQNEKGDRSKEIDLSGMKSRFSNIKDRLRANFLTFRGIEDIQKAVQYYVQNLPHVGELLPKQWIEIRHKLESLSKEQDYITLGEYLRICNDSNINDKAKALKLSEYMHDLGIFLHFQDDLRLKNIFILRNTWATDAVYKILDNEKIKAQFGKFDLQDIQSIWDEPCYLEKHAELIALMTKFELCYQLVNTQKEEWIAPQLLPVEKPHIVWEDEDNLSLQFRYEFMPKGLLSRLIVRMSRYIYHIRQTWRHGVVLHREETKAIVEDKYATEEIRIRVSGKKKKELLTLISEEMDSIHKSYPGLKVKKLVPCNCKDCKKMPNPHYFDYDNLIRRKENRKNSIECDVSYDRVEIKSLLDGLFKSLSFDPELMKKLLIDNKLEQAIKLLKGKYPKESTMLLSQFKKVNEQSLLNLLPNAEIEMSLSRIKNSIYDLL